MNAYSKTPQSTSKAQQTKLDKIRTAAEADLQFFINLIHPKRLLGGVHRDIIRWWTRDEAKTHSLLLLPRDHMKSTLAAYRVAWSITRNPAIRVLYISSTSNLATKQLKFIKDILESPVYRKYWPEMVNQSVFDRERWNETEISVDHPLRKSEAIRDPTVFTAGLTTGIVGFHCDLAVLDDVVTGDNADTEEGRNRVRTQYSFLGSVEASDAEEVVVGTRYHPEDLYGEMQKMSLAVYDEHGETLTSEPLYDTFVREVEDVGDGSGEFLWPRQQRDDGVWFGFNQEILAKKKAQYLDRQQFRAQYYNDPSDRENAPIQRDWFEYYDRTKLAIRDGKVYYAGNRLNVFASIDFAVSLSSDADYTSIVVVGVDKYHNYYVLDIERFKTNRVKVYFDKILLLHKKWYFRKILAEVSGVQGIIVEDLKENYIRPFGLGLVVEKHRPTSASGSKEERIFAALAPRYENRQVFHYKGGNCELLEAELTAAKPPHDDIKDALASCITICTPPTRGIATKKQDYGDFVNPRFGGFG